NLNRALNIVPCLAIVDRLERVRKLRRNRVGFPERDRRDHIAVERVDAIDRTRGEHLVGIEPARGHRWLLRENRKRRGGREEQSDRESLHRLHRPAHCGTREVITSSENGSMATMVSPAENFAGAAEL